MRIFFNLIVVIVLLSSCNMMNEKNTENSNFTLDDAHLENETVLNEKKFILDFIKEFDEWYKKSGAQIQWYEGWSMAGYESLIEDEFRINFIKTNVLNDVEKTNLLTKRIKDIIINDIQTLDDPYNLGTLLLENKIGFGKELYAFIQFENNYLLTNYNGFNLNVEDIEDTYEELESCYLKMISIGEVIKYNFPYSVVMNDHDNYYVNVFIIKEEGNYKVDKIEVKAFKTK